MVCRVIDIQARTGPVPQVVDVRPLIAELRRERRWLDRLIEILERERRGGGPVEAGLLPLVETTALSAPEPESGCADR